MRTDEMIASWAATEADLRWVLAHSRVPADAARWVTEYLDHNELGLAYEVLVDNLQGPSPELQERLRSAATRMGLPPGDIPAR
jgi:hypothetical protein